VVVAIAAMFILPDFPENSSNWLSPAEQSLAMRRMAEDAGMDEDPDPKHRSTAGLYMALSDGKVWCTGPSNALFSLIDLIQGSPSLSLAL
jgi:hypothetical protein